MGIILHSERKTWHKIRKETEQSPWKEVLEKYCFTQFAQRVRVCWYNCGEDNFWWRERREEGGVLEDKDGTEAVIR